MTADILFFFRDYLAALPVSQALKSRIIQEIPKVLCKVQKAQITSGLPAY